MIGSAVSKGMETVSIPTPAGDGLVTVIANQTGNQTNLTSPAGDQASEMSAEELNLRLQFAMSTTFLVGVIQVSLFFIFKLCAG